ncbi:pyruvate kinase [Caproiciproducens sp. MSJ-32]|uniref:pyruvate kinase n=1 Tax=Caproiciproducens sp. MSJ-32 TaxID=2841527 RepID=UPI001C123655|nr:pyruvate kinase [Caproiciproducens sp. MSJ-32]MBU5455916.1 pyruvate kinase [Caproiciproducens sp. MSJ-32]
MQKTKMIFTIGPASDKEEIIREFIKIGMSAARLNFSHGTHETHKEKIDLIKKIRNEMNSPTAIILDIKGPKIRTHKFINDGVELFEGQDFTFICDDEIIGDNSKCSVTYKDLYKDVNIGGEILVDDGLIRFKINDIVDRSIKCKVTVGGIIKNNKGVNLPNAKISLPSITEKDKEDIIFGCKNEVDFIAASFVRKASDVLDIRKVLDENSGENIRIISKIENQEGVDNIDDIIEVSDGIMIARGDMGVEIPIEKVPIIQKQIIRKCNEAGKIVITATQMLDSMIRNSIPTRAEACDICNAIFDGTDAIMLSGESASGLYPIEAAKTMSKIALETEANLDYIYLNKRLKEPSLTSFSEAISYSACRTSNLLNAKVIVAATNSGTTAKLISKYRPKCPIIAITPHDEVRRCLNLNFGVFPTFCQIFNSTDEILREAKKVAENLSFARKGDDIVVAAGIANSESGGTNMLKVYKL